MAPPDYCSKASWSQIFNHGITKGCFRNIFFCVGRLLNQSRLKQRLQAILANLTSQPSLLSMTSPSLGCSPGYRPHDGGCSEYVCLLACRGSFLLSDWLISLSSVACPAGTLSKEGACHLCPEGTYQDTEGQDFCNTCPRGSSPAGSSAANQCE